MSRSVFLHLLVGALLSLNLVVSIPARSGMRTEAQESLRPYWVFLAGSTETSPNPLSHELSPRAVRRLTRVGHVAGSDVRDQAIPAARLAPLLDRGITIRHTSRFLQAASALLTDEEAAALAADPRVREVRPVVRFVRRAAPEEVIHQYSIEWGGRYRREDPTGQSPATLTGSDYGEAWDQLEMLGIPELHARGYSGRGVMVALFDSGFFKDHESLSSLDLVAERDFVQGDANVQHDPADTSSMHPIEANRHGTYTWSALGGFAPGRHLGGAYGASFVLARTEDISREVHLEEDHFIAALEWADSLGVDIVSSSLGYLDFDDDSIYTVDQLDGHTLPITQATAIAAGRGILVITSMGNQGPTSSSLIAPADGDSVVSVGAVNLSGDVVGFSSRGPTGDGRIKPDVTALGWFAHCAASVNPAAYSRINGTSLATPLVSGLAALLIEADSTRSAYEWILALRSAGDHSEGPTNSHGWGIPDGLRALGDEGPRLIAYRYDWTELGGGDGVIDWGETGELRIRIRNVGSSASPEMTLSLAGRNELIVLIGQSEVSLPSLAPGDSIASGVMATAAITEGETAARFGFFVRFEGGEVDFERKVYVALRAPPPPFVPVGAYPNPIRVGAVRVPVSGTGPIRIFSVEGRLIRTILARLPLESPPMASWDLKDASGRVVPPGIYFVRDGAGVTHRICVVR